MHLYLSCTGETIVKMQYLCDTNLTPIGKCGYISNSDLDPKICLLLFSKITGSTSKETLKILKISNLLFHYL